MKFIKTLGLSVLLSLGLTACGDDDNVEVKEVVVVEKVVIQQPAQQVYVPPVLSQRYTMMDVENEYRSCLMTYGLSQDDYCEEVCSYKYNAYDCDTIEDYYEETFGIGADHDYDAFFVAKPRYKGTQYRDNKNYGKTIVVSKSLRNPPKVVRVNTKYTNQFTAKSTTKVVSPTTKVSTTKVVTPAKKEVKKIGTGEVKKYGNQFASKDTATATKVDVNKINSSTDNTVKKIGSGGTVKYNNQFVKKPAETQAQPQSVDTSTVAMVGAGVVGVAAANKAVKVQKVSAVNVKKNTNQFTNSSAQAKAKSQAQAKDKAQAQARAKAQRDKQKREQAKRDKQRRDEARRAEKRRKEQARRSSSSSKKKGRY